MRSMIVATLKMVAGMNRDMYLIYHHNLKLWISGMEVQFNTE